MGNDSRGNWIDIDSFQLEEKLKKREEGLEDFFLLDVRNPNEEEICSIFGTNKLIPIKNLDKNLNLIQELVENKEIVIYCKSGIRSKTACEILFNNGFTKILHLKGGILEFIEKLNLDLPVY